MSESEFGRGRRVQRMREHPQVMGVRPERLWDCGGAPMVIKFGPPAAKAYSGRVKNQKTSRHPCPKGRAPHSREVGSKTKPLPSGALAAASMTPQEQPQLLSGASRCCLPTLSGGVTSGGRCDRLRKGVEWCGGANGRPLNCQTVRKLCGRAPRLR